MERCYDVLELGKTVILCHKEKGHSDSHEFLLTWGEGKSKTMELEL